MVTRHGRKESHWLDLDILGKPPRLTCEDGMEELPVEITRWSELDTAQGLQGLWE